MTESFITGKVLDQLNGVLHDIKKLLKKQLTPEVVTSPSNAVRFLSGLNATKMAAAWMT